MNHFLILSFLLLSLSSFASDNPVPCGLNGSLKERIKDCSEKNKSKDKWRKNFILIKRNYNLQSLFMDKKTGLIWSTSLGSMSFDKALRACSDIRTDEITDFPELHWRLPGADEYKIAAKNNIVDILAPTPERPDIYDTGTLRHHRLWTSTITHSFNDGFKVISVFSTWNQRIGEGYNRGESHQVRCVASTK